MLWGACLWIQKLSLGVHDKNGYSTTITTSSNAWDACVTNNAFYEYMTICDKERLTRPPTHLQVALREKGGSSSAPLFQNHTNYYTTALLGGFFTYTFFSGAPGALATVAYIAFLNSLPDILISGGNLNDYKNSNNTLRKSSLNSFYSTVWHELTHASNFRRVRNEKGVVYADSYWNSVVSTEVRHNISSGGGSPYGKKGDSNWEQIALVEGWANYREWDLTRVKLNWNTIYNTSWNLNSSAPTVYPINNSYFPYYFAGMFYKLKNIGCSHINMEKSLCNNSISSFKNNLIAKYSPLSTQITTIISDYE